MSTPKNNPPAKIETYLIFEGRCEEAIEFYKKALGAEVEMMLRFKDSPEPPNADCGPVPPEKIMHANLKIGGTHIMASDGQCQGEGKTSFQGFSLSIAAANEAEAGRFFTALSDGGEVRMPLTKTFFSPSFGMVADRFGVNWMVMVAA